MNQHKDILDNFSEKFPLLKKIYELYQKLPELSKNEENTLRKSSEITLLEILELIVIATRQQKSEKVQTLRQAVRKLETLKVFADMAKEVKSLSDSQFNKINESLQDVGRMIGGWHKAVNATK